jgi:hypothetical protein
MSRRSFVTGAAGAAATTALADTPAALFSLDASQPLTLKQSRSASSSFTPAHCRAARALLDLNELDLASATGVSAVSILAFERSGEMCASDRQLLRLAFDRAGVAFIDGNGGGPGVRLKQIQQQLSAPPQTLSRSPGSRTADHTLALTR